MQRAYLDCHRFPIPCLAEDVTNAEVLNPYELRGSKWQEVAVGVCV